MHYQFVDVNDAFNHLVTWFNLYLKSKHFTPVKGSAFDTVVSYVRESNSRNGKVLQFVEPVTITYQKPWQRVLFNTGRLANPFFHLFEALWMLEGRNDVAPLLYYNKNMLTYSDDAQTLNGAYGRRWRRAEHFVWADNETLYRGEVVDQLEILVNHLKADPNSRRAVLQMWNVEDDLLKIGQTKQVEDEEKYHPHTGTFYKTVVEGASKDVCCNLSVMFSLQEGPYNAPVGVPDNGCKYLDMTVTNRSNDLIWGLLGANYVHFTLLQEYMAARLGVEVGLYHHFTNNLHVYLDKFDVDKWLSAPPVQYPVIQHPIKLEAYKGADIDNEITYFVAEFSKQCLVHNTYKSAFLERVAKPMLNSWVFHKRNMVEHRNNTVKDVAAPDWQLAAANWYAVKDVEKQTKGTAGME